MIDNNKVKSSHTRRAAIVYIRQSHPSQVENNRESTARQYALAEKAIALGWDRSQVITIDEDLGVSGKVFVKRSGFDHLNAEVALGRIGFFWGLKFRVWQGVMRIGITCSTCAPSPIPYSPIMMACITRRSLTIA